jgi:hypothetical protein
MTGYQSKKAAAQDKLTVDRTQVEQWLEALKDIDALHHSQEPESVDAQKAIADMGQALAAQQEPVAWPCVIAGAHFEQNTITTGNPWTGWIPLYTTPPAAQPVGQAPCVQHCEATAFQIVIKNLRNEIERMKAAQPEQERNFCPRCGKRTADLTVIHTCTPPQEKT